jgi:hypothetical protein
MKNDACGAKKIIASAYSCPYNNTWQVADNDAGANERGDANTPSP